MFISVENILDICEKLFLKSLTTCKWRDHWLQDVKLCTFYCNIFVIYYNRAVTLHSRRDIMDTDPN